MIPAGLRRLLLATTWIPIATGTAQPPARDTSAHAGHQDHAMPIPMPKGMVMLPGLMGLRPPVTPFLPGRGSTSPPSRTPSPGS